MDELTNEQTGDEWEKEYRGISVKYEKSWVRIVCDQILKDYLGEEGNGSLALADYALGRYKEKFGCELNIKRHSLAVEILAHVYADKFAGSMLDMKKGLHLRNYRQWRQRWRRSKSIRVSLTAVKSPWILTVWSGIIWNPSMELFML